MSAPCDTCGHDKEHHIYHEGACRPGFMCTCEAYVTGDPIMQLAKDAVPLFQSRIDDLTGFDTDHFAFEWLERAQALGVVE